MNKVVSKIDNLRQKRGWTVYKLSVESGISQQAIHKWNGSNTFPSIPNLQQICNAFGMTLGEFFTDSDLVELTPELKTLINDWRALSTEDRKTINDIIKKLK